VISTIIWLLCVSFDYLVSLMTIIPCYFICKLSNISTTSPNDTHRNNKCEFGGTPCSHQAQGCNGCKLLIQVTHSHHPAMLFLPWRNCYVFAASKNLKPSILHSFDSDSFQIKTDNCASKCITNCIEDFTSPLA
jgi:hypothetical protein